MPKRDADFSAADILQLAHRVNHLCSRCRAPTRGPNEDGDKSTNLGKAAHIHAASPGPGAARYDPDQSDEDRCSAAVNGIWMCAGCADLIDKDWKRFPASMLYRLKAEAEHEARQNIGVPPRPPAPVVTAPSDDLGNLRLLLHEVEHVRDQAKEDAASFLSGKSSHGYDYKPIADAVARVPLVFTDSNLSGHLKSFRDAVEEMGRGGTGAELVNRCKNVSNYGDHLHGAVTALIKRMQAPAAPARVQVASPVPDPVPRTRNLKITINSEPVATSPPELDRDRHRIVISATNVSNARIKDWIIDVEFPAKLLVAGAPYQNMVKARSTEHRAFFRFDMSHQALLPRDTHSVSVMYRLDQYWRAQAKNTVPALFVISHVNGVLDSGGGGIFADLPGVKWKPSP